MKTRITAAAVALLLCSLACPVYADVVIDLIDPITGADSGWSAILADDIHNGIVVDKVRSSYVRIEISKDFYLPPVNGCFPPNTIIFQQRLVDALTVPTIQITDETIFNNTGVDWTDYHWEILGASAAFDKAATDKSGFSINPFTNKTWGAVQTGWGPDHRISLNVDGGVVADGEWFLPGLAQGKLYIDTDLSGCCTEFALMQCPTPEPGTLLILAGGAAIGLFRRNRRRI
ncbi:MAG: PEP-CTERM sorting domain-containing protein [Planctomycetota bacterium]|nr:PEP-CTERM sorting domain-containing protein [Planctomycetota bacterium]